MKPPTTTQQILLAVTSAALISGPAAAALFVHEPFDYAGVNQNINTRNGGTGFGGAWAAGGFGGNNLDTGRTSFAPGVPGTTVNGVGGLEFPGLETSGSGLARFGTAGQRQASRILSTTAHAALTQDNTTIWFSILMGAPSSNAFGTFIFGTDPLLASNLADRPTDSGNLSAEGQGFGVGFRTDNGGVAGGGSGSPNAVAFVDSYSASVDVGSFIPTLQPGGTHRDTVLIIGKINWNPAGTADELFLFNMTSLGGPAPDESDAIATLTADFDQTTWDRIAIWDTGTTIFDEIRLGTSFNAVIPEPSTALLSGFALLTLLRRRR